MPYLRFRTDGTALAAVTAAMLASCAACVTTDAPLETNVGDEDAYTEWDVDDDGVINEEEFVANVQLFQQYDVDDSGYLDEDEFEDGFSLDFGPDVESFEYYDVDDNGVIGRAEFHHRLFDNLDIDDDGTLDRDEWGF